MNASADSLVGYARAEEIAARLPRRLRLSRVRMLLDPPPSLTEVICPCCWGVGHLGDVRRRCPLCHGWCEVSMGMTHWWNGQLNTNPDGARPIPRFARAHLSDPPGAPKRRKFGRMGETAGALMNG